MSEAKVYSGHSIRQTRELVAKEYGVRDNAKKHPFLRRNYIVRKHDTIGPNRERK